MLATRLACYRMGNRPITKNGRKMAGEMASGHFFWGAFQNGRKMAAEMHEQLKFGNFLHIRPFPRFWLVKYPYVG